MSEKLFFSQEIINSWTDDEKVKFDNDTLSIQSGKGVQGYKLTPAYRFVKVSDGGPDPHSLIDAVHSEEELAQMGADAYLNSCILGETAYDVEQGYVAVKAEDEKSIEELLMDYLAKTLI
jgi:hypothetical protein